MSSIKQRLVYAVVQFLREQSQQEECTPDEQESLEVAVQCLETVFKLCPGDQHLAVPQTLEDIFSQAVKEITSNKISPSSPSAAEKAEQLKDEGNAFMKEQNYDAAVDCYSQAIELDPSNAVYYCNRAAAQSQRGKHSESVRDCEKAISIDAKYSKAYGRMGRALVAMSRYKEAIESYQKALDLDPQNESYRMNLKLAEQKLRQIPSPISTEWGFDMASLMNNPAFVSMAASLMRDPQVQQLMSGMMSNAAVGPAAGVGGLTDLSSLIQA
ncbi:small glutamine-rich tetratricopeptide repeat-containing protein beta isoform X2 [Xenopus laevis]|nr:small glutamine-rich tetratricopeptide repeat-containing protein beta isoform X2 [Xenopus laevis]